jgi:CBS domain-containing protein
MPISTLQDITRKMMEQKIGSVLITDESGELRGILTDRDIAMAVAAEMKDPSKTCAEEIMSKAPFTTEIDSDLETALRTMNKNNTRRLPVTEKGKLVGILSSVDVACAMKEQFNQFLGLEETYIRH